MRKNTGFFVNTIMLMGGRSVEALIGILCMPFISRLFLPVDYGTAVSLISITSIIMPLATLTYERAIILTTALNEQIALSILSCLIAILFSVFISIFDYYNVIDLFYNGNQEFLAWLWVLPIYIFIRAMLDVVEQTSVKKSSYKSLAVSGVLGISIAMALRIYGGYVLGSDVLILISAYVLGMVIKVVVLSKTAVKFYWFKGIFDFKEIFYVARKYSDFPKYQVWGSLFRAAANNLPVILFAILFSSASAGVYAMTIATTRRPLEALLNSYRSVFLQRASLLQDKPQELLNLFKKHNLIIFGIGVIPFTALFFFAPQIFLTILGETWQQVGEVAAIISLWLFSLLLSLPSVASFVVIKRQRTWFRITVFNVLLQLSPLILAFYYKLSFMQVLWGYSILGSFVNILMIIKAYLVISKRTSYV